MNNVVAVEENLDQRLARRMRELRLGAGLTLKTLAEQTQTHWRYLQKIEAAQATVTLPMVERIARAMEVNTNELLQT